MDELNKILNRIRADRKVHNQPTYNCPICKDSLIIFVDQDGHKVARDCECAAAIYSKRRMRASGVSDDDINRGFNDFKTLGEVELENIKQKAFNYFLTFRGKMLDRNNSLLLSGKPGRGKTTLGFAVFNNILKNGTPALYVSYREMITLLKQIRTDETKFNKEFSKYSRAKVLFLDDLFKGEVTKADKDIMYELINYRYLKRLPMIISTEKTQDELLDIDEALGSRIIEMCKGNIVVFSDNLPNYRLR